MHPQTPRPTGGLPPRLKLLIVELAGIAMMVGGIYVLFDARARDYPMVAVPLTLALVGFGVDLLLRPGARRRLPRVDKLLFKAIDRWRAPPTP
jgi:hypothetical protein